MEDVDKKNSSIRGKHHPEEAIKMIEELLDETEGEKKWRYVK